MENGPDDHQFNLKTPHPHRYLLRHRDRGRGRQAHFFDDLYG